jgi:hypothetical protein
MTKTTNDRLEHELKEFYALVPPPPGGLAAGRQRMLAKAASLKAHAASRPFSGDNALKAQTPERRRKMKLFLAYKILMAVIAVVMGTTAAGGGVVFASADSLPGDALYPVKVIVEDTRLALTADPDAQVELTLAFAAERVEEMQRLMAQGKSVPQDVVGRMAQHTEQVMAQIAQARQDDIPGLLEQVMERMRRQEQALEQVRSLAPEETLPVLHRALEVTARAYEIASAATKDPARFQKEYRLRLTGTPGPHEEGSPSPSHTPMSPCETCTPERDRDRDRDQDQTHMSEPTITPMPSLPTETCETCTPEQDREQERESARDRERTHTPEPTTPPTSPLTHTPAPTGPCETCTPEQDRDRNREQEQNQNKSGTLVASPPPTSMPTHTPVPTHKPLPTHTSKHDGQGSGH